MKSTTRQSILQSAVAVVVLTASARADACATCFGQTDSPLGVGLNWGIFVLLVVVNSVLAGICSFFVFVARRSAKIEAEDRASRETGDSGLSASDAPSATPNF